MYAYQQPTIPLMADFRSKSPIDVHETSLMSPKIRHQHQVS